MANAVSIASSKDLDKEEEVEKSWSDLPPELKSLILAPLSGKKKYISTCRSIVSSKDVDKEEEVERLWSNLPLELLHMILARLFGKDCVSFRSACSSWRSIPIIVRPLPPPLDSLLSESPCLMNLRGDNTCKLFHPIHGTTYHMKTPYLVGARIRFSSNGWLLMCDGEGGGYLFFFNPITKVIIRIPDIPITKVRSGNRDIPARREFTAMSFSSRPTSLDCVIIGMSSISNIWIRIGIIKYGEEDWTMYLFKTDQPRFYIFSSNLVFHNGVYYCLGAGGNVGIFDPGDDDDEASWTIWTVMLPKSEFSIWPEAFLVECDGDLLAVYANFAPFGKYFGVFKLDRCKMIWQEQESLGDKVLYVCRSSSFSETASMVRGTRDRIYFPFFNGNSCSYYSLTTRKCHSVNVGDYSTAHRFRTVLLLDCTWIKS